jgi:hypothetical protein
VEAIAAASALVGIDAGAIQAAAQRFRVVILLLRGAAATVAQFAPPDWSGVGHDASAAAADRIRARLGELAAGLEAAWLALSALVAALRTVQGEALQTRRELAAGGADVREPVSRQLEPAVQAFDDADRRAAGLLCDALLVRLAGPPSPRQVPAPRSPLQRAQVLTRDIAALPPEPSTPAAVAVWWAGLPAAARAARVSTWPRGGGGLDGLPAQVRDAINRRLLAYALAEARRDYQQARPFELYRRLPARARIATLRALLRTLQARGSELLTFDDGGDGQAVVASGDVESSRSVAVLVPGMATELDDVPELAMEGARLVAAAGPGTVVVSWLGYDAPGLRQVASDAHAKSGAVGLQRFMAGLRATGRLRQHLTVIGHSYGTLVAGIAARRGLATDDLVLLASPGVEAARAAQLGLPPGHVWAASAATDPIQLVFLPVRLGRILGLQVPAVYGPDPAGSAFGARRFATGGAYGHSGYFTAGSESLKNLGRIAAGRPVP